MLKQFNKVCNYLSNLFYSVYAEDNNICDKSDIEIAAVDYQINSKNQMYIEQTAFLKGAEFALTELRNKLKEIQLGTVTDLESIGLFIIDYFDLKND